MHPTVLVDEQATVEGIRAALEDLYEQVTERDCAVIFLSGHGLREGERQYFFATHETVVEYAAQTSLPWQEVQNAVRGLAAKQVVVLVDTCHSGAVLGERRATNEALAEELAGRGAGALVFASSSGAQESVESEEWGHGAFTYAILELLEGRTEARGPIGPMDLASYVSRHVKKLTERRQEPHIPLLTNFSSGTVLFAIAQ